MIQHLRRKWKKLREMLSGYCENFDFLTRLNLYLFILCELFFRWSWPITSHFMYTSKNQSNCLCQNFFFFHPLLTYSPLSLIHSQGFAYFIIYQNQSNLVCMSAVELSIYLSLSSFICIHIFFPFYILFFLLCVIFFSSSFQQWNERKHYLRKKCRKSEKNNDNNKEEKQVKMDWNGKS